MTDKLEKTDLHLPASEAADGPRVFIIERRKVNTQEIGEWHWPAWPGAYDFGHGESDGCGYGCGSDSDRGNGNGGGNDDGYSDGDGDGNGDGFFYGDSDGDGYGDGLHEFLGR